MRRRFVSVGGLTEVLRGAGIALRVGSWVFRIRSDIPEVARGLGLLYPDYDISADPTAFADFHIRVRRSKGLRRWLNPQVVFEIDGDRPFRPFPASQAMPMLEWGMNWCVSNFTNHLLVLHSAVLEKDGGAVLLPAPPTHGKSTLCAALASCGWRLLSDELALVDLVTGLLQPFPRPISLKNASIEIIRAFSPGAVISPRVRDTVKGDIAYMRPSTHSVARADEPAAPRWIVFPRYRPGSEANLTPIAKAEAFRQIAEQAFNYYVLGRLGFESVAALVDRSACFQFEYERLESGVAAFAALSTRQ